MRWLRLVLSFLSMKPRDDQAEGLIEEYHANGKLKLSGTYRRGKKVGLWTEYHENGRIKKTVSYSDDPLIPKKRNKLPIEDQPTGQFEYWLCTRSHFMNLLLFGLFGWGVIGWVCYYFFKSTKTKVLMVPVVLGALSIHLLVTVHLVNRLPINPIYQYAVIGFPIMCLILSSILAPPRWYVLGKRTLEIMDDEKHADDEMKAA